MDCRIRTRGIIFLFVLLGAAIAFAQTVHAQAKGWCEEKYVVRASTLNDRITVPAIAADAKWLYIAYRQGNIKVIRSGDQGKTWSDPVVVGPDLRICNTPAIVTIDSKVVVVWSALIDVGGLSAFQLFFSESVDNGQTFSGPRRIARTRDDAFSPRFLVNEDQALLMWLETPLAQTLGNVPSIKRPDFTPDSVEALFATEVKEGRLEDKLTRVRSTFYTSTFSSPTSTFTAPERFDSINAQNLPHIFCIYGPIDGNYYITLNRNTEIVSYQSKDNGQTWTKYFQDRDYFDPRKQMDVHIINQQQYSAWTRYAPGANRPINFQVKKDDLPIQLSPEHSVRSLPRMVNNGSDFHIVWEAGRGEDSWVTYIRTDKIPPAANVVAPTDPALTDRTVTFTWQGNDNISSTNRLQYAFTYGDQAWSMPQSENQTTIKVPPDGDYVFKVRCSDVAGNYQEPPVEFRFNTYKSAPDTRITQAPNPNQVINARSVEVRFTGEDNTDSPTQLEYATQTDDLPWTPFVLGTSFTFTALSNGEHALRVKARDSKSNEDNSPAEVKVNIKVGMELVMETLPPITSNSETISFGWSAKDDKGNPIDLTYYYRLDKAEEKSLTEKTLEVPGLEEGRHEIIIWGRDVSGDETPKESFQWTIDRTPPDTSASFTKEYMGQFPLIDLGASDPALSDGSRTTKPTKYQYQIGDGSWVDFENVGGRWNADRPLSFYSWGYQIKIQAIDFAGNVDPSPALVDLRIHARTNPYIFYSVVGVAVIILLFILKLLIGKLGDGMSRRPIKSTVSSLSMTGGEDIGSSFGSKDKDKSSSRDDSSTFKLNEEDDDLYK